jgi:hypothetical protein
MKLIEIEKEKRKHFEKRFNNLKEFLENYHHNNKGKLNDIIGK